MSEPQPTSDPTQTEPEQPFLTHLLELRDRVLRVVLLVLLVFLGLFAFANDIYTMLAAPLLKHMPAGGTMIATEVAAPFLTPIKLTLMVSLLITLPFLLYQIWGFVAPGLYRNERRMVMPLIVSSTLLFFAGMAFAYYIVFPLVFGFIIGVAPEGVAVMTDISKYLDFVLKLFFAFGVSFEIPIATILLVWSGMTTPERLAQKRPYVVVGAFVFGMLLTPPDAISQTLLAIPMWILFELGIVLSRIYVRKPEPEPERNIAPETAAATVPPAGGSTSDDEAGDYQFYEDANDDKFYTDDDDDDDDMSDEDMEAELDRLEKEEADLTDEEDDDESEDSGEDETKPKE